MPLPSNYEGQGCSMARTLEVVGERWTLLIVRDALYGVRRFGDFVRHLGIPRAVLTERLNSLVEAGVLFRVAGSSGRDEYVLTDKGTSLWPVIHSLVTWGDENYAPSGPRRLFLHDTDGAGVAATGLCSGCGAKVPADQILAVPGPGLTPASDDDDEITVAMRQPHRLLQPLR